MNFLPFKRKMLINGEPRKGFSLVVSLVIMGLMLLIAIALVSFVVLESQLTEYRVKRYQAQANAICGLRIAMGQLQLLTGDDQRVTATADILERGGNDNKSLPAGTPVNGKRYWTGVWATGGLNKTGADMLRDWDIEKPNEKAFLGWLVSDYNESTANYSPIEQVVAKSSADSSKGKELIKQATSAFSVDEKSVELVTLVGAGTVGKKDDWEKRVVKVRRVPMEKRTDFQKAQKNSGSFAYWVGDEGVKARVNIADAYSNADGTEFSELKNWGRGMRATAQRVGVEIMPAYEMFETWWKKDMAVAGKVEAVNLPYAQSAGGMAVYAGDESENFYRDARALYHDVSFFSRGVFSDVYNGGLKTDLSVAFEMPWFDGDDGWSKGFRSYPQFHGSNEKNKMSLLSKFSIAPTEATKWWLTQPSKGLGYVYEFDTKSSTVSLGVGFLNGSHDTKILRGPTWDVFRNYYRLYKRENENLGIRGFKPSNSASWLATGSAPYTYLEGSADQKSTNAEGNSGVFGAKYNYSFMTCRGYTTNNGYYDGARSYLPMYNGEKLLVPQSMRISPVVLRFVQRFAVVLNADTAAVVVDPIFVVHNPYNVPIEFFGFGSYWTKFYPFDFDLTRTGGTGTNVNWPGQSSPSLTNVIYSNGGGGVLGTKSYSLRWFAGTNNFNTAPNSGRPLRLLPGEIKAVFPNSATAPLKGNGLIGSLGSSRYEEQSQAGFEIPFDRDAFAAEKSDTFSFTMKIKPSTANSGETDMFVFNLFYPQGANGQSLTGTDALKRSFLVLLSAGGSDWVDGSDENIIQTFGVARNSLISGSKDVGKTFSKTGESGYARAQKQYFALYDLYKAPAEYSPFAGPLLTNTRPAVIEPRNWDYKNANNVNGTDMNRFDTAGVGWVSELKLAQNDFSPVEHVDGNAFWGDDITSSGGQSSVVLYEIPQRPMLSLGQFQSVDCTVLECEPSYVVGNSYPPLGIKDLTKTFEWSDASVYRPQPRADHAYAANLALFDRYFFSGINFGKEDDQEKTIKSFSTELIKGTSNPMANKRVTFIRDRENIDRNDDVIRAELQDPNKVARNFLYEGMFNVNSTSVEAWKAQLASLHGQYLKIDGAYSKVEDFPIVRFATQIGSKIGGDGSVKDTHGNEGNGWRWYRSFKDSDLQSLAEKIVEQVRMRGPFMSMADFVNRRIAEENQFAQKGALQAAIDEVSKINNSIGHAKNKPDSGSYPNLIPSNNNAAAKPGAPGYLTQGDILSCLGAGMSVRSDTFTIRAYGDVFGLSGVPEARAYCEAVVQRLPDWVVEEESNVLESDDKMTLDSLQVKNNYRQQNLKANENLFEKFERNIKLKAANRLFGRRYKIVSFRWLSPDEI